MIGLERDIFPTRPPARWDYRITLMAGPGHPVGVTAFSICSSPHSWPEGETWALCEAF